MSPPLTVKKWWKNPTIISKNKLKLHKNLMILTMTSVKSLSIKSSRQLNSFSVLYQTQHHIFVFGPCLWLMDNCQRSFSRKQSEAESKAQTLWLFWSECTCSLTLPWVSSWVWTQWSASYTLYVSNGSNSTASSSKQMDGNSLLWPLWNQSKQKLMPSDSKNDVK